MKIPFFDALLITLSDSFGIYSELNEILDKAGINVTFWDAQFSYPVFDGTIIGEKIKFVLIGLFITFVTHDLDSDTAHLLKDKTIEVIKEGLRPYPTIEALWYKLINKYLEIVNRTRLYLKKVPYFFKSY